MKKVLAMILALLMLMGGALAESEWMIECTALEDGVTVETDLDGDGSAESVVWYTTAVDEYDEMSTVLVMTGEGQPMWSALMHSVEAWICDVDSDGQKEIIVSGDQMSDDYMTYCLRYAGGELEPLLFADVNRGENFGGYFDYGYGRVTAAYDNVLRLTGSQDTLGTYMAARFFTLKDGVFELSDDGLWHVEMSADDAELWEYRALTAVQEIPAIFVDNGAETEGTVRPGERVCITAFDKVSVAHFVTEDGRTGRFSIAPDEVNWGWTIGGIPESELFEYVPYAD